MSVDRFDCELETGYDCYGNTVLKTTMDKRHNGDYVLFTDYEALANKFDDVMELLESVGIDLADLRH